MAVVRSQAEHDFLNEHAAGKLRPFMIGAYRGDDGLWYDTLGERQYFFLWDTRNRQPQPELNERLIAIYAYSELAIERGQE